MIIIGAGNGLSRAVAYKFGKAGYKIGLISRSKSNLENLKIILNAAGVEVWYETADVSKTDELHIAINTLDHYLEGADVVLYNAAHLKQKDISKETAEALSEDFKINVIGLQQSYNFLQNTLKAKKGALLVSGGGLALQPSADYGSLSLGKAALRSLVYQLHGKAKVNHIYVGLLTIAGFITKESKTHAPALLADIFWNMNVERKDIEIHQ